MAFEGIRQGDRGAFITADAKCHDRHLFKAAAVAGVRRSTPLRESKAVFILLRFRTSPPENMVKRRRLQKVPIRLLALPFPFVFIFIHLLPRRLPTGLERKRGAYICFFETDKKTHIGPAFSSFPRVQPLPCVLLPFSL